MKIYETIIMNKNGSETFHYHRLLKSALKDFNSVKDGARVAACAVYLWTDAAGYTDMICNQSNEKGYSYGI
jgi:hypothetical protein